MVQTNGYFTQELGVDAELVLHLSREQVPDPSLHRQALRLYRCIFLRNNSLSGDKDSSVFCFSRVSLAKDFSLSCACSRALSINSEPCSFCPNFCLTFSFIIFFSFSSVDHLVNSQTI